jgi:hypothetical protein
VPDGRAIKRNIPLPSVTVEAFPTSLGLVAPTVTPGRGLPWLSTTFPVIFPSGVSWAKAIPTVNKQTIRKRKNIFFFIRFDPPFELS